jgi:hypothetical protein
MNLGIAGLNKLDNLVGERLLHPVLMGFSMRENRERPRFWGVLYRPENMRFCVLDNFNLGPNIHGISWSSSAISYLSHHLVSVSREFRTIRKPMSYISAMLICRSSICTCERFPHGLPLQIEHKELRHSDSCETKCEPPEKVRVVGKALGLFRSLPFWGVALGGSLMGGLACIGVFLYDNYKVAALVSWCLSAGLLLFVLFAGMDM